MVTQVRRPEGALSIATVLSGAQPRRLLNPDLVTRARTTLRYVLESFRLLVETVAALAVGGAAIIGLEYLHRLFT